MSIGAILAAASGGGASGGAIDLACQLARRFEAHLEGFHVLPDARTIFAEAGDIANPGSAALVESLMAEAVVTAAKAHAQFDEIVARHGIGHAELPQFAAHRPSAVWREETGSAARLVAGRGRFFDLVVLGRSERVVHQPHSNTVEATLVHSGRPLLLAPAEPPSGLGYIVAVAWDGSLQAVRGLAAALPFLERANAVSLITAGAAAAEHGRDAMDYLGWHGVFAEHRRIATASGRQIGASLFAAAAEAGADLLVMGGYGHMPWREALFGGATRAAVATMPLPLLLMH
jgi:nucleotide-binding universal stress UspA family protein